MARQVLDHGVIIPAEYSDDWYEDMSTNLEKLDEVIGSDAGKLSEADVSNVALSGDYDDLTKKPELKPVATSGDYDDLTNKPGYGILRITSETLSDSGSGAISNLNSDSKLAAGDYVLDAALKVFPITAVSAPNYTVGTSLFQITNASALAAVATSGSYDDLNNLPAYGITRFVNAAISDNSNVAFANINSVDKIKAGDFLLDNAGKMYLISSIDSVNETAAVTTPLTVLALDANVMHLSGNETKSGELTASKFISNYFQSATGYIQITSNSTNRSVSMFNGSSSGDGGGFWAYGKDSSNGSDCRMQIYNTSKSRYEGVDLVNSALIPNPSGELDCGKTSNKWKSINGINPGALSLPDFSNVLDISGYITVTDGSTTDNLYTVLADGYISINLGRSSGAIGLVISNGKIEACVRENTFSDNHRECGGFIPVQKNDNVVITSCLADSIIWAYFIPCLGNV